MSQQFFITGATGHIGSAIAAIAVSQGHTVHGLSRTPAGDTKLTALGAVPVRGDLSTLDVLTAEAAAADAVFHLADPFLDMSSPNAFDLTKYDEVIEVDAAAVEAMAAPLKGTPKALVVASGSLVVQPDPNGGETDETAPINKDAFVPRWQRDERTEPLVGRGVRLIMIRLAPYVYGHGASGIGMFVRGAAATKQAVYVDDGLIPSSAVHVDDAATCFLLAAAHGKPGDAFNATSDTSVTPRALADAMAAALGVPAVSVSFEAATQSMGPVLPKFFTSENRASSAKAVRELGWKPTGPSVWQEFESGSYAALAKELKQQAA